MNNIATYDNNSHLKVKHILDAYDNPFEKNDDQISETSQFYKKLLYCCAA